MKVFLCILVLSQALGIAVQAQDSSDTFGPTVPFGMQRAACRKSFTRHQWRWVTNYCARDVENINYASNRIDDGPYAPHHDLNSSIALCNDRIMLSYAWLLLASYDYDLAERNYDQARILLKGLEEEYHGAGAHTIARLHRLRANLEDLRNFSHHHPYGIPSLPAMP